MKVAALACAAPGEGPSWPMLKVHSLSATLFFCTLTIDHSTMLLSVLVLWV